jgi:hypothetical protein
MHQLDMHIALTYDLKTDYLNEGYSAEAAAESLVARGATALLSFGLAGGLAWVGVLTFGVVSEQLKTRSEVAREESGSADVANAQEVLTPSGLRYTDLRRGGGEQGRPDARHPRFAQKKRGTTTHEQIGSAVLCGVALRQSS